MKVLGKQILCHFTMRDFIIRTFWHSVGSWDQSLKDTEGQLYMLIHDLTIQFLLVVLYVIAQTLKSPNGGCLGNCVGVELEMAKRESKHSGKRIGAGLGQQENGGGQLRKGRGGGGGRAHMTLSWIAFGR